MKSLSIEVPDQVAAELARLVEGGWFVSQDEAVREALREFVRSHRAELQERFQLDDVAWAVSEAKPKR